MHLACVLLQQLTTDVYVRICMFNTALAKTAIAPANDVRHGIAKMA